MASSRRGKTPTPANMLIPKKNRKEVYKYLFKGDNSLPRNLALFCSLLCRSKMRSIESKPLPQTVWRLHGRCPDDGGLRSRCPFIPLAVFFAIYFTLCRHSSSAASRCLCLLWTDRVCFGAAEGVLFAEKDFNLREHPEIPGVSNLQVIKLMQSFTSKELVTERFAWRHYYW